MADPNGTPAIPESWQRTFRWIEERLGGRIVRAVRQPRWRPAWSLDLERDGEILPLYFRGERGEADGERYSVEREGRIFQALEAEGVPVPHVHLFSSERPGIVMDRVPGRANLATAVDDAEREAVLDHYMEILHRIHSLPLQRFERLGLSRPEGEEAAGLCDLVVWERGFRRKRRRAEPALEFLLAWLHRNVPRRRTRVSFICCDAGQFLFDEGRVTAVLDLELAQLGDSAADLGALPGRDLSEPLGDLSRAVRHYEEVSGEVVDRRVIDYHCVRFATVTPLALAHLVAEPSPPGIDLVQYLGWYVVWTRCALEGIAARQDIELDPIAAGSGEAEGAGAPAVEDFADYERATAERMALLGTRRRELGPDFEAADLAEAAELLGRPPSDRSETDAELESLVTRAGPERDADLIRYFHRRMLREETILYPVLRELQGARMQRIV